MKNVIGKELLEEYDDSIVKKLQPEIYVTVSGIGNDTFAIVNDSKEDAVQNGDSDAAEGELVATYKLVKVEVLKLVRTTKVVSA